MLPIGSNTACLWWKNLDMEELINFWHTLYSPFLIFFGQSLNAFHFQKYQSPISPHMDWDWGKVLYKKIQLLSFSKNAVHTFVTQIECKKHTIFCRPLCDDQSLKCGEWSQAKKASSIMLCYPGISTHTLLYLPPENAAIIMKWSTPPLTHMQNLCIFPIENKVEQLVILSLWVYMCVCICESVCMSTICV